MPIPQSRGYLLDRVFDHLAHGMDLRRPQRDSLGVVHELFKQLPHPLSELSASEIARRVREVVPEWDFPAGHCELTFALATGTGKTRLMGAIMAYLYKSGESTNFLLLAPRDAILRKLEAECREGSPKYIFVNRGIVPQPALCHRGNLLEFDPARRSTLLPSGPNTFVLSPQLFSVGGRVAQPSEFVGTSILEYLRSCEDLVVLVDESHHLNPTEGNRSTRTWAEAVRALRPKFVFAMTATPRDGVNVACEYDLARCLRDRLYTKSVRVIVDEKGGELAEEQYDHFTLRYALSRIRAKEGAISRIRETLPAFPGVQPVLLICAQDVRHADQVGTWLVEQHGLAADEVLVIHSQRKTEADIARLTMLERRDSRVKAVVQVHVLDEGWDVTNVYVIAPLRNVRSYVNARQVMGRGLRLPLGYRVGDPEVDALDVLAFGQEAFQSIYEQATRDFGDPTSDRGGLAVVRASAGEPGTAPSEPVQEPEDVGRPDTVPVELAVRRPHTLRVPVLDLIPPEPDLNIEWDASDVDPSGARAIELGTLIVDRVGGDLELPWETFVSLVVDQVLRDVNILSEPVHGRALRTLVERYLQACGIPTDAPTRLDPVLLAGQVADRLLARYYSRTPTYRATAASEVIRVRDCIVNVPRSYIGPLDASRIRWNQREHAGLPCAGWARSTHVAATFDSFPEFEMAKRLDRIRGIEAWLRNWPAQIVIPTIAGRAKPDFVVWLEPPAGVIILEVKGEHLWQPRRSESWVKARDARLWTEQANAALANGPRPATAPGMAGSVAENTEPYRATGPLEFHLVLGGDVERVDTLDDLRRLDAAGRPEAT